MARARDGLDSDKFINTAQAGGIESYVIDQGEGRGVRALCVNTGGGLRYRVLVDRGLDIDQAFFNQHSLTFLTHKGVTPPTRALDRGMDWLKGFPGGLMTCCGPLSIGSPTTDDGEELGLHGTHSATAATVEAIVQPDPRSGRDEMSIRGVVRYGAFYEPCVELRRTIRSRLGSNVIEFTDEFFNAGTKDVPHAWLLHINFGYPLLDVGAEFCYEATKVEAMASSEPSVAHFREGNNYKRVPPPPRGSRRAESVVGYIYPKARDRSGRATVAVVNRKIPLAVAIHYSTKEFPRCGNWQYFGRHEYIAALEPMNGTVEGRDKDRARGLLDTLQGGQRKIYRYQIEVLGNRAGVEALARLNGRVA